jgi:hypothetical protein
MTDDEWRMMNEDGRTTSDERRMIDGASQRSINSNVGGCFGPQAKTTTQRT